MEIQWTKDADAALAASNEQNKLLLIDFTAAPG